MACITGFVRLFTPLLLLIPGLATACTPDNKTSERAEGSTQATDAPTPTNSEMCDAPGPTIEVTNETSLSLTALRYRPCDGMSADETFPFPGGELGESASFHVSEQP